MTGGDPLDGGELTPEGVRSAATVADIARILRQLRRRDARGRGDSQLSYRELAAKTGWAHGVIGDYFSGRTLPPTDRFDVLVSLLGATPQELGALATARDRVEEKKRHLKHFGGTGSAAPHQLPAPAHGFVGRDTLLARADEFLSQKGAQNGTRIMIFSGTAGVGKTALALQWARRVESGFPDGSLYVDLRGFGGAEPVTPEAALIGFLRSLGAAEHELAAGAAELAARFRSLIAGRRMIIMLDNARGAEQVRPLLPGTTSSLALVTSRDHLAGLVARDGAHRLMVPLLPAPDALRLLGSLTGRLVAQDLPAAAQLAERCARLPLALRIAAELATRHPSEGIAGLVTELDRAQRALDLLDAGGDTETAVRQIFSWSYRGLSSQTAACFRALGLFPGAHFEIAAVAALAGTTAAQARRHVTELVSKSLVEQHLPGRYTQHDLLRAYAAELAADDPQLGETATGRLLEHYLRACGEAVTAVYPAESASREATMAPEAALAWLDAELPTIVTLSADLDFASGASQALWPYLDRRGRYPEAMAIHGNALAAARARGDTGLEAAALGELGQANARLGRYGQALEHLHLALDLSRGAGDLARAATTLNSISIAYSRLGRGQEAIEHLRQALALHRELGNRVAEGKALSNLGIEFAQIGRYREALDHFTLALEIARESGDRYGQGNAHNNLGLVSCWLGRYEDALRHHHDGLACARDSGDHAGQGRVLANLGVAHTRIGDHGQALACLEAALRIHREVGDRAAESEALTYLGDLSQATGDHEAALRHHELALAVAQEIGYRHVQASARNGAGRALCSLDRYAEAERCFDAGLRLADEAHDRLQRAHALAGMAQTRWRGGDPERARGLWQRASAIYTELDVPERHTVRDELRVLPHRDGGAATPGSSLGSLFEQHPGDGDVAG
ncbi:MAG TPA: tetratricopeptide repeat protein [Candidatus Limnocylindrales bacterium]|nr:tetratricopeptide repeat protein [Candidatus Limnocylindrales bacterium]